jgi:hypothetical protein
MTVKDHPISRDDVRNIAYKYEQNLGLIAGYKGVDLARRLQACSDLVLDETVTQLRTINLGHGELLERIRQTYAEVFTLLDNDAAEARKANLELEEQTRHAEEEKTRTITGAKIKIAETEQECARKVKEAEKLLEDKSNEYDDSMKRFLEQKSQLERHVKALHRVFLDFQKDAVYLTLEELKQEVARANQKTDEKNEEIRVLENALNQWKEQYQEMDMDQKSLDQKLKELRQELQDAQETNVKLLHQLDFLKMKIADGDVDDPEVLSQLGSGSLDKGGTARKGGKNARNSPGLLSGSIWLAVYQRLSAMGANLSHFIERMTGKTSAWEDEIADRDEQALLGNDGEAIAWTIARKVDQVNNIVEAATQMSGAVGQRKQDASITDTGRFLRYFSCGIAGEAPAEIRGRINVYTEIRRIWQAKYLSDKWNSRSSRPLLRFPEFVVCYYFKDDANISTSLHHCKKLWKSIKGMKAPEVQLFRRFLKEKYTLDELSFFLEMRHGLVGLPCIRTDEPGLLSVPLNSCRELMARVLGAFSPVASLVGDEAQKLADQNGNINYAVFLGLFIKFYAGEREKRKTAVKLIYNSRKLASGSDDPMVLEVFVTMVQSLGYRGPLESMLELFRHSRLLSGGEITLTGIWQAMDELGVHFSSIDIPLETDYSFERSEDSRNMLLAHWAKFGQWFEGLRRPNPFFEDWVRSKLALHVRRVEQSFQLSLPGATLYAEYRRLLDEFQFFLNLMARGAQMSMTLEESQQQLEVMEGLNSVLLTFVLKAAVNRRAQVPRLP